MAFVEWVFSGLGTAVAVALIKSFRNRSDHQSEIVEANPEADFGENENDVVQTEAQKVSQRMNEVVALINARRRYRKYTVADVAQLLDYEKVSDLENLLSGKQEPTFSQLKAYASEFKVNYEWLTTGYGTPFKTVVRCLFDPEDYLSLIEEEKPERVYFVKCRNERCEMFIVLKHNDWSYSICPKIWHISSCVGAGGEGQIHSLFKMIQRLRKRGLYNKCDGVLIGQQNFDALYDGSVFAGAIIGKCGIDHWFDDFSDVYHKYPIAKGYGETHGEEFLNAQSIVRSHEREWGV